MREQDKIDEAAVFLDEMAAREEDPRAYVYMVSAFLSAARSVLQYAREEATSKSGGQQWYDGEVSSNRLLPYFKDKRDANVHQEPVEPARTMMMRHEMRWPPDEDEDDVRPPIPCSTVTHHYRFADWSGSDDVLTLCRQYLDELRAVVADGHTKGFLTT
jgi:hypothetical protein